MEQRWLSKTGICTVLGVSPSVIDTYVKQKFIVRMGKAQSTRYLDPTPEYVEQLKLGQAIHKKTFHEFVDLFTTPLLTPREIMTITRWSMNYTLKYLKQHKTPGFTIGKCKLYSPNTLRDILWERQDRKGMSKQMCPFLLAEIIRFFSEYYKGECEEAPTDAQFAEDELLQRKINRMMRLPSEKRVAALSEFMAKVDLAKRVVAADHDKSKNTSAPKNTPHDSL
jgi:hypothetical protein